MSNTNPFDYNEIDDVIHGRLRLGIMACLIAVSPATFGEVRDKVGASDGNLSTHLKKLDEAGYVEIEKRFVGKRPQTRLHMTKTGRKAWRAWLSQIETIIKAAG